MNIGEAIRFIPVLLLCAILSATLVLVYAVPPAQDLVDTAENNHKDVGGNLYWKYYFNEGRNHSVEKIELNIPFEEYHHSATKDVMRTATALEPPGISKISPEDKYVLMVVKYLEPYIDGLDDFDKVKIALNFVQSAIRYVSDPNQYGEDYIAYPIETLFLGKGDCEDTSILLASIYLAMGYDAVLLDYSTHIAVGVRWSTDMEYLYCETACDSCNEPSVDLRYEGDMPVIFHPDSVPNICIYLNDKTAEYRNRIKDYIGI